MFGQIDCSSDITSYLSFLATMSHANSKNMNYRSIFFLEDSYISSDQELTGKVTDPFVVDAKEGRGTKYQKIP